MISDRILGQSEQISVPATTIQFFTGNNILPSGDMVSRSFIIRLDVDQPDPENRNFKHPDPFAWTKDHRAKIMRSLYTLLVWNPYLRTDASRRSPATTRFKRWWTLCGAPVEKVASVDFAKILSARETEDTEVSAMAALLSGFRATFDQSFTAQDVAQLHAGYTDPNETIVWTRPVQALLEDATGRPFPRGTPNTQQIGKRLQMIVGRPAGVEHKILTLERTPDTRHGNKYRVTSR
jgi:hypothetical protein